MAYLLYSLSVMMNWKSLFFLIFLLIPYFSQGSLISRNPSAINRAVLAITEPSPIFYGQDGKSLSPQLIATYNQVKAEEKLFDMSQIVPLDLPPTDDGHIVFSRIADQSVSSFFNSPEIKQSQFGKTAVEVESKLNQNVNIGNSGSIQHKLNLNFQAFQSSAVVQYVGFTNVSLKYKALEHKVGFEVSENIGFNKKFSVNHSVNPEQYLSTMNFHWSY